MNAKDKALLAPLTSGTIGTLTTHSVICRTFWKNGQTSQESLRYTSSEMLEVFTRLELEMMGEGLIITRSATYKGGPTTKWVSGDALANRAFS